MILVTASILFVRNYIINNLLFAVNLSLIFAIYYELQKQLLIETSATFFTLSPSFLAIMPFNDVPTKD